MSAFLSRLSQISILRFAVIGSLGMPVDWCVLQLCVHLGTGPYFGRVIAWLCAASFTWLGNRYFTFVDSCAHSFTGTIQEWGRFLAANAVGGLVNVGLVLLALAALSHPWPALAGAGTLVALAMLRFARA